VPTVTLSRFLGGIGRTLISAGVLLLLFVVYQLWGTGLRTGAAQASLRDDFQARKAEYARQELGTNGTSTTAPRGGTPPASTPTTAPRVPAPKVGQPVGLIRIPRIGVEFTMVEGVDLGNLARGPGHFPSTPLPGQAGNAAIAGHRVTYSAPFNRIDELAPGDRIHVETFQGAFTYEVQAGGGANPASPLGHRIISPYQTEILDQAPGRNTLTLMACHPKFDLKERIVVVGQLVEPPAPDTPRQAPTDPVSSLPEDPAATEPGAMLVGGDSSGMGSALGWSALAALVWLAAWLVARRWPWWSQPQRWAVFAAALPLFAVPLFLAFEGINDLLPAGY
jgi:sortase A